MSSTQIQMTPDQLKQNILRYKGEKAALEMVIGKKREVVSLIEQMEGHVASGNLSAALSSYVEIQRIEVGLIVAGLEERLTAIDAFLKGAESPITIPTGTMPPLIPGTRRQR